MLASATSLSAKDDTTREMVIEKFTSGHKFESYKIENKFISFLRSEKRHITITEFCGLPGDKSEKCEALSALEKVNLRMLDDKDKLGGKDPGAVLCRKHLSGKMLFGQNKQNNPVSFCAFRDGSIVTVSTLSFHGRKNAKNK